MKVTVKIKILGIFSVMLALIVLFQAANYFLTLRNVRDLQGFHDKSIARHDSLELRRLLYEKLLALGNYALYPDENHMDQFLFADKSFTRKVDDLRGGKEAAADKETTALLGEIKSLDDRHNHLVERLVGTIARGEGENAVAEALNRTEAVEKQMFDDIDGLSSAGAGEEPEEGKPARRSVLAGLAAPLMNPLVETGREMRQESRSLWNYTALRDLAQMRTVACRRFLLTGSEKYVEEFNRYTAEFETLLSEPVEDMHDGRVLEAIDTIKASDDAVSTAFRKAVLTYRTGDREKARALALGAFVNEEVLSNSVSDLVEKEESGVNSAYAALTPIMSYAVGFTRILLIFVLITAGIMAVVIYGAVSRMLRPIVNLGEATRKIAQGDWTQRLEVRSRDEIGSMASSFNRMTEELEKTEMELLKRHSELSFLYDVSLVLGGSIDLDRLLSQVLDTVTKLEVFNVEKKGAIFIVDGDRMTMASSIGESESFTECREIKVGECLCGLAAQANELVFSQDSTLDKRHVRQFDHSGPHGHIIVPLKAMDKLVGVMCLFLAAGASVEEEKKRLLYILGGQIGVAIENAKLYEETKALSLRDSLTGLANRRMLEILLDKSFSRATRFDTPFSVLMLDIDFFKKYNDTYGHPAGDAALVKVARIIQREIRDVDLAARYGGEEFLVLLPDAAPDDARMAAERIRKAVEADSGVTISLGTASYYKGVADKEELINEADEALYRAKQNGRNRVEAARREKPGGRNLRPAC